LNKISKYISNTLFKIFLQAFKKKKIDKAIYFNRKATILIINFGSIQDILNITPLAQVLSEKFSSIISFVGTDNNIVALKNNPHIENIYRTNSKFRRIFKLSRSLSKYNYDIVIDVNERIDKNVSYLLGLLKANFKVGFKKDDSKLFTHTRIIKNPSKAHIVDRILSQADLFEIKFSTTELNICFNTSSNAQTIIDNYIIKNDLKFNLTVLINISSKENLDFWGIDNFRNLLKYLNNYKVNLIIVSSIQEIELAEKLISKGVKIFYDSEFDSYAELIKNVDFIFSPDSYTVQLAAAYKIPVFCLFVQHNTSEMINVPYNSDFDFALTEKPNLSNLSYGKVLNSFVPYFEYIFEKYSSANKNES